MTEHDLKTTSKFYQDVFLGITTFIIRLNDKDFKVGDILHLMEIDDDGNYTGNSLRRIVTYTMTKKEHPGILEKYIVMGIDKIFEG